jgi:hypothetical protein
MLVSARLAHTLLSPSSQTSGKQLNVRRNNFILTNFSVSVDIVLRLIKVRSVASEDVKNVQDDSTIAAAAVGTLLASCPFSIKERPRTLFSTPFGPNELYLTNSGGEDGAAPLNLCECSLLAGI